jgi:hypothetical protein
VLRLYDVSSGQVEGIRPAYPGELRVLSVTTGASGEPDSGQLRAWLLPDLIRRCAERRRLVPTICEITGPMTPGTAGEPGTATLPDHAAARAALNIHPPARIAPASEPAERMAEFVASGRPSGQTGGPPPFDVGTGDPGWFAGRAFARYLAAPAGPVMAGAVMAGTVTAGTVTAGAVTAGAVTGSGRAPFTLPGLAGEGVDPLALRLAFLGQRYRDDLTLNGDALHAAGKTLQRWRESVAEWALSPSGAMSRHYAETVTAAFEDDLDTPAALRQLEALEADEDVPAGAKFETFAALDRLFGLDLARDIGKVSAPRTG